MCVIIRWPFLLECSFQFEPWFIHPAAADGGMVNNTITRDRNILKSILLPQQAIYQLIKMWSWFCTKDPSEEDKVSPGVNEPLTGRHMSQIWFDKAQSSRVRPQQGTEHVSQWGNVLLLLHLGNILQFVQQILMRLVSVGRVRVLSMRICLRQQRKMQRSNTHKPVGMRRWHTDNI